MSTLEQSNCLGKICYKENLIQNMEKGNIQARDTAHSTKLKYEDQTSSLSACIKSLVWSLMLVIVALGRWRQEDLWSLQFSQPTLISESAVTVRDFSSTNKTETTITAGYPWAQRPCHVPLCIPRHLSYFHSIISNGLWEVWYRLSIPGWEPAIIYFKHPALTVIIAGMHTHTNTSSSNKGWVKY